MTWSYKLLYSYCIATYDLEQVLDTPKEARELSQRHPSHDKLGPNPRKRQHGPRQSMGIPIRINFPSDVEHKIDNMITFYSTLLNPKRASGALSDASIKNLRQQILVFLQYLVTEKNHPEPGLHSCLELKLVKSFAHHLLTDIGMGYSSVKNYLAAIKNASTFQAAKSRKCAKNFKTMESYEEFPIHQISLR